MITVPDRISEVIAAVERGEQVDMRKLHDVLALDLVRAGQQFANEAAAADAEADSLLKQLVDAELSK